VSAAAPGNFTGNITLSCTAPGVTCTFNPTTIFAGQTSALTVSGLTAATANPFNFTINGTSGSQNATAPLAILFADYTLSVSPALNTITAGQPAGYTVVVTPLNGFNQQIQLACTNLPPGATCGFSQAAPTPNGSPVNVTMTVNTVRVAMFLNPPRGPFRTPPLLALCLVSLAAAGALIRARRRHPVRATSGVRPLPMSWRFVAVSLVLVVLSGSNACRSISSSGTTTGNYTITVTGTLGSNTTVLRSTTFNLSVT
jgi:hypothetical protein